MDLLALGAFNLVAAQGGFGRASRVSGQPKTTLSRRVRDLEDALGVRLIERGARSLRLTEDGAILHVRTQGPLAEIADAGADVAAGLSRPRGRLRVSVPVLFAHVAMGRVAAGVAAAYPEVTLEVVAEDRLVHPVEDGFDVVVRINPGQTEGLVGRLLFSDDTLLLAAPSLAGPDGLDDGRVFPAVTRFPEPEVTTVSVEATGTTRTVRLRARLHLSSLLVIRDAVRAGAGAALLPRSLVRDDLACGRLVLWGTIAGARTQGWVLHTSRRLVSPKVSAFVTALHDALPDGQLA